MKKWCTMTRMTVMSWCRWQALMCTQPDVHFYHVISRYVYIVPFTYQWSMELEASNTFIALVITCDRCLLSLGSEFLSLCPFVYASSNLMTHTCRCWFGCPLTSLHQICLPIQFADWNRPNWLIALKVLVFLAATFHYFHSVHYFGFNTFKLTLIDKLLFTWRHVVSFFMNAKGLVKPKDLVSQAIRQTQNRVTNT